MGRKKARENAFKCVFQLGFENDYNIDNMLDSILENEEKLDVDELEYITSSLTVIMDKLDTIDNEILKNLKGWTIDRISKVDLAILRLAIFEIKFRADIPYKVSINEAVELAKSYGDDKSSNFINGLLSKIEK